MKRRFQVYADNLVPRHAARSTSSKKAVPVTWVQQPNGPWSGNNNLGNEVTFDPNQILSGLNRQTVLRLPENGPPMLHTITLGIDYDENLVTSGMRMELVAEIEYGAGGIIQSLECDWLNGQTISLPMNALNLVANYALLITPSGVPKEFRVSAQVGLYSSPHPPPTRSFLQTVAAGSSSPVPFWKIPKLAKRVRVVPGTQASAANLYAAGNFFNLHTTNTAGSPVTGTFNGTQLLAFSSGVGIPIPGYARYFSYDNAAGANVSMSIIFELAA